jgi:hypothetical protein
METTAPPTSEQPESREAIRQQLHEMIEILSDELCAELHALLRLIIEEAAPTPPGERLWQDIENTVPLRGP